jgi:hypothetical protein
MVLKEKDLHYLKQLLQKTEESFDGLSSRWDELQPKREFNVKMSEDFHLGYVFGSLEDHFVSHFYSEYGISMTDQEYHQFWKQCREFVRELHAKYDLFYFQE